MSGTSPSTTLARSLPPRATAVTGGAVRLRVRPWRDSSSVAEIAADRADGRVPVALVEEAARRATELGYEQAVTPALAHLELRPYLDAGFAVREHLHLLAHDLRDLPPPGASRSRRVRRSRLDEVLALDAAAFSGFWRLDRAALSEALDATPSIRLRIHHTGAGYALFGRARHRGYLQRLAVDQAAQGRGVGTALMVEGMWWLRRWRVRELMVNTQASNARALALYERHGFRRQRHGLAVLQMDLGGPGARAGTSPDGW